MYLLPSQNKREEKSYVVYTINTCYININISINSWDSPLLSNFAELGGSSKQLL